MHGKAGAKLPQHSHEGMERVFVLQGAFRDGERFEAGDLCETDCGAHRPSVADDMDCLCLIATDNRLKFNGLAGVVAPLFGV
jgi:putative transcriptional regulator